MTIQDLIITPIYLFLFTGLAFLIRPMVTTKETVRFFMPALLIRFFGAIMLGLIYQFYYDGGDTFNYFTHGSKWIWEAFMDSPELGLKLLLESGGKVRMPETFQYSQYIWYYKDPQSFLVVRIAAIFDIFTLHTYSATALFFAFFSFSGLWALFTIVSNRYQRHNVLIPIAILFIPSVIFWGSGILKDTITLGALGWFVFATYQVIEKKKINLLNLSIIGLSSLLILSIKPYIVISAVPTMVVWVFWKNIISIENWALRIMIVPVLGGLFLIIGYLSLNQISNYSEKYSIDAIAQTAAVTAYDIRYGWGARTGGDGGYDLGELDGSWQSMLRLMPQAIVVTLFRPFPWEVKNPLMLLSALEAILISFLTIRMLFNGGFRLILQDPFLVFCLAFSLLFAFAVGVSTFNFGTLMRYKIPMMPFYWLALVSKNEK